jgi:hypothetical protein
MTSAARLPTPVMVSRRSRATANGAITSSMRPSRAAMAPSRCPLVVKGQPDQQPMVVAEAAAQRLAQLGELLWAACPWPARQGPSGRVRRRPGPPAWPGPRRPGRQWRPRPCLLPASSRVFWIRWHSAPWAWKGPLAVAGQIPQLADLRRGHEAAAQQPALGAARTARRHHRHRSCGRAGSWSWRALTSSSWNPRSSSTYQIGFQLLAGGLHHHLGDALGLQPVRQGIQAGVNVG